MRLGSKAPHPERLAEMDTGDRGIPFPAGLMRESRPAVWSVVAIDTKRPFPRRFKPCDWALAGPLLSSMARTSKGTDQAVQYWMDGWMSRLRLQRPSLWTNYRTTLPPSSFSLGIKTPALTVQASFHPPSPLPQSLLCLPSSQPLHSIVPAPPTLACPDLLSLQSRAPPPPISQTPASISSETPLPHLPCQLPLNKTLTHSLTRLASLHILLLLQSLPSA